MYIAINVGMKKGIGYISTGGGAFLEFLEGTLPAIAALQAANRSPSAFTGVFQVFVWFSFVQLASWCVRT